MPWLQIRGKPQNSHDLNRAAVQSARLKTPKGIEAQVKGMLGIWEVRESKTGEDRR